MENKIFDRYKDISSSSPKREEVKSGYQTEMYDNMVLSYLALRRAIGVLGVLLPILLMVGTFICHNDLLPSISHYYHSSLKIIFSGILISLATFFLTYRGADQYERIISQSLSILAICIVLFPTANDLFIPKESYKKEDIDSFVLPYFNTFSWVGTIHFIFAGLFFALLVVMIFFKFIKQEQESSNPSLINIRIYKCCGWGMLISIGAIILFKLSFDSVKAWELPPTFMFESLALLLFGISWLVKGDSLKGLDTMKRK